MSNAKPLPALDRSLWPGSTWDRVCRELFGDDRRKMLAWGRRYLAAYPDVHAEAFHLGARFREIVGARNRLQWWRSAVELLSPGSDAGGASRVAETATAYGREPVADESRPASDAAERLRIFDAATERQRRRERAAPVPAARVGDDRGWTRDDLYD